MYMCVYLLVPFMLVMRKKKQGGLGWAVSQYLSLEGVGSIGRRLFSVVHSLPRAIK